MKWLGYTLVAVIVAGAALFTWYLVVLARPLTLTEPLTVTVPEGSGTEGMVTVLYEAGVIRSRYAFLLHLLLTGQRQQLQAGDYVFSGQLSIPTVLQVITKQRSLQGEVQMTLVEGWTNAAMAQELADHLSFTSEDFLRATKNPLAEDFSFLSDHSVPRTTEGFLFPDTYRFFVDATPQDVVSMMLRTFDKRFTQQMRTDLAAQERSLYEAVTLASIVEKEARHSEDMKIVADIFWRRFDIGMRLESDATINYITKKNDTTPSLLDLDVESAYNTYRNAGLPPTPICNPGFSALEAVVYPTPNNYWYFLTTPDGEMKYSETYDQHLQYKAQYYP